MQSPYAHFGWFWNSDLSLMQICIAYAASYAQFGQCIFQLENLFLTSLAVENTPQWQNSLQSFKNTIFPTKQSKNYKLIQN